MRGLGGIGTLRRVLISLEVIELPIGGNLGVGGGIFLVGVPLGGIGWMEIPPLPFVPTAAFDSA